MILATTSPDKTTVEATHESPLFADRRKIAFFYFHIVMLLLIFWGAALHYMIIMPPFEGTDEDKHFGYVTQLRDTWQIPDSRTSIHNLAKQESSQPPLLYVIATFWSRIAPDYDWAGKLAKNPWVDLNRPVLNGDNANEFMFGFDQVPYDADPDIVPALRWLRLISPLMGMLTVTFAYAGARVILPRSWALFAALIFAFNPVTTYLFSYLTNDAPSILFGTWAIYGILRILRRPLTPGLLLLTGAVIGVGMFTKASVLVFVPVAGLAVAIRLFQMAAGSFLSRQAASSLVRYGLLLALPVFLIGGTWYGWRTLKYGDPFGFETHTDTVWALEEPRPFEQALVRAFDANAFPIRTMWYGVSSAIAMPQDWTLVAPYGLLIFGLIGYGRHFHFISQGYGGAVLCLFLICLGLFIAYVRWLMEFIFLTGRLMLPGYLAFCLLVTLGMAYGYGYSTGRLLRLFFASLVLFIGLVIVAGVTLPQAFLRATFPADQPLALSGNPIGFGEAELMGYQIAQHTLGDTPLDVILCWRSLRSQGQLPMPYAFGFNIVDENNAIYAGRESYPGLGKYTLWKPDAAFCDQFSVPIEREVIPAHGYRISVGLFDPETLQPVQSDNPASAFLGWIAAPGPALSVTEQDAALYSFEDIYLLDYVLEINADTLTLETSWGTGIRSVRAPRTAFIHVVDTSGEIVAQLDEPLGEEIYPAFLWGDNERTFVGTYSLSLTDIEPGNYHVYLGLYHPETLARLSVVDREGVFLADQRIDLGNFHK